MYDIRFRCPDCRAKLVVDVKYAGETVPCPKCSQPVTIPEPRVGEVYDQSEKLAKARRALGEAVANEGRASVEAAELRRQLDQANEKVAAAEAALGQAREAFDEELKRERATLALETQAHQKREQEAEVQARQAESARKELAAELERVTAELKAKTAEAERTDAAQDREGAKEAMKRSSKMMDELRAALEKAKKEKAKLAEEVASLRKAIEEKEGLIRGKDRELEQARAASAAGADSEAVDSSEDVASLRRQLEEKDRALKTSAAELEEARADAERMTKAHEVQLEVQRLERKLREQQQATAELARQQMEERQNALTAEVRKLQALLGEKDRSMREVVDGERTEVDLSAYRNPTLEKLAAAEALRDELLAQTGEAPGGAEGEQAGPKADGTLTPLPNVGEDLLPRYTSPRPYYHELPQVRPGKSLTLVFGWILASLGIVGMILSPANLLLVYAPLLGLALLLGIGLWFRRRTPMVAGLLFLTILIPAMVWFGVEEGRFEGLAPELEVNVEDVKAVWPDL